VGTMPSIIFFPVVPFIFEVRVTCGTALALCPTSL
jgi:hypothetical protein